MDSQASHQNVEWLFEPAGSWIMLSVAGWFILASCFMLFRMTHFRIQARGRARGTVTGFEKKTNNEGEDYYYAIFSFSAEGRDWTVTNNLGTGCPHPYKIGQQVNVHYPEREPARAEIPWPGGVGLAILIFVIGTTLIVLRVLAALDVYHFLP